MANFQDILDQPMSEIKAPPPLPPGSYVAAVSGQPNFSKVGNDQTDVVDFTMTILQPGPDVDVSSYDGEIAGKNIRNRFFITEAALFRLTRFLQEHLGLDPSLSTKQAIAQAAGRQCMIYVTHGTSKDGSQVFANIDRTGPL